MLALMKSWDGAAGMGGEVRKKREGLLRWNNKEGRARDIQMVRPVGGYDGTKEAGGGKSL